MPALVPDPDGRPVSLSQARWQHIVDGHPELKELRADVLRTVRSPDRRRSGDRPGEEWFYSTGPGPSRWLKVVVIYERDRGWIVTAFPRRTLP